MRELWRARDAADDLVWSGPSDAAVFGVRGDAEERSRTHHSDGSAAVDDAVDEAAMTTGSTPALNEPTWLQIARKHQVKVPPEKVSEIPPPGDGAEYVSWALESAGVSDYERQHAQDFLAWGRPIDTTRQVPPPGTIVIITNTASWKREKPASPTAAKMVADPVHVGFLAGSTSELIYVLGEGIIRAFPRTAVASVMNGEMKRFVGYRWPA